jgi:hypothetical protein
MSIESDMFHISVIGPKANVTRMLNEAIRQEGTGDLIVEGDDIETINRKLTGKDGKPGMMVAYAELLDQKSLDDDAILKEKWLAAVEKHNQKLASEEYSEDEYESSVELFKVEEYDAASYEVKFSEYLSEWAYDYECIDWAGWEDIARVYKCRIFVDDLYYRNGVFMRFDCATIYEPDGEEHRFGSGSTREEYDEFMDKLVDLYPERYTPIRERYLEEKEAEKMRGLKEEEDEKERQHLEEELHIKLNQTAWSRFASDEEDGVKAIRRVYDGLLWDMRNYRFGVVGSYFIPEEEILNVLKVRAEKWKGVNDELAGCYEELIRSFNEYCDTKKECKYDCVWDFCEGLARVCKDKKYGFIDTTGREVVPCKYVDARDFREGMAYVELWSDKTITFNTGWTLPEGRLCGYVDKTGREVIPCQYSQAWDFSDGLAKVTLEIWDPDMPEPDVPFPLASEYKKFFIDKTGAVVLEDAEDIDCFFDGLSRISRNGKTGFADKNGHEVIPCKYDGAHQFCEGMAIVSLDDLSDGVIDKTGREVVPCGKYDDIEEYHEGFARVKKDDRYGFVDKTGREVIPCEYDWATDFYEGLSKVKKDDEECYIDKDRRVVLKPAELGILVADCFSDGLAKVICESGGKRGYIDRAGQLVIPYKYDEAHDFHDGLAMVKLDHIWGFIDKTGQMVLPGMYIE